MGPGAAGMSAHVFSPGMAEPQYQCTFFFLLEGALFAFLAWLLGCDVM